MQSEAITLTDEALEKALELSLKPENSNLSLRLYLDGKGCDGFYYGVSFDPAEADDLHFPQGGIDLVIDPRTHVFCKGAVIEWVDDERGQGFLVSNPREKSFRGKFFKKSTWRDKLEALNNQSTSP